MHSQEWLRRLQTVINPLIIFGMLSALGIKPTDAYAAQPSAPPDNNRGGSKSLTMPDIPPFYEDINQPADLSSLHTPDLPHQGVNPSPCTESLPLDSPVWLCDVRLDPDTHTPVIYIGIDANQNPDRHMYGAFLNENTLIISGLGASAYKACFMNPIQDVLKSADQVSICVDGNVKTHTISIDGHDVRVHPSSGGVMFEYQKDGQGTIWLVFGQTQVKLSDFLAHMGEIVNPPLDSLNYRESVLRIPQDIINLFPQTPPPEPSIPTSTVNSIPTNDAPPIVSPPIESPPLAEPPVTPPIIVDQIVVSSSSPKLVSMAVPNPHFEADLPTNWEKLFDIIISPTYLPIQLRDQITTLSGPTWKAGLSEWWADLRDKFNLPSHHPPTVVEKSPLINTNIRAILFSYGEIILVGNEIETPKKVFITHLNNSQVEKLLLSDNAYILPVDHAQLDLDTARVFQRFFDNPNRLRLQAVLVNPEDRHTFLEAGGIQLLNSTKVDSPTVPGFIINPSTGEYLAVNLPVGLTGTLGSIICPQQGKPCLATIETIDLPATLLQQCGLALYKQHTIVVNPTMIFPKEY